MTTAAEVMSELAKKGSAQTCKTYARHGAPAEMFGVKIGDLKAIAKQMKGQQALAYELYATGNSDAMYLAGLVADGRQMTKKQLDAWVKAAGWYLLSEYTVPWVAAESPHGRDMAIKWIDAKKPSIAACGWATYASWISVRPDDELDLPEIQGLLERIAVEIHQAPNRVRYTMNGFVIAVGAYVKPLLKQAKSTAKKIGQVNVDMGDTACQVPLAAAYIQKIERMGRIGKKRKTTKC